jgi:hypothetical protein
MMKLLKLSRRSILMRKANKDSSIVKFLKAIAMNVKYTWKALVKKLSFFFLIMFFMSPNMDLLVIGHEEYPFRRFVAMIYVTLSFVIIFCEFLRSRTAEAIALFVMSGIIIGDYLLLVMHVTDFHPVTKMMYNLVIACALIFIAIEKLKENRRKLGK